MEHNQYINLNEVDPDYNVFRYEKFKLDISEKKINKICMTEIVNADMMIATFGLSAYMDGCKEVLTQGRSDLVKMGLSDKLIHYMYNYKNFIVAGTENISDKDFGDIMEITYEHYVHSVAKESKLNALSRFVVVYGGDLIDRAQSAFYLHKKSQNNYIIASNERELLNTENRADVEIFNLLNYAINNDTIIPYYQGIYNNKRGVIDKYEALMRVADEDGKVYPPYEFLNTAKKFKLYHTLSKKMIDKALKDFELVQCQLGINLSLLDVENEDFASWFVERVKNYSNPSKLTIEFVETENYNSGEKLYTFLNTIREFGCKIAVDDFGVGFATYTSIISLKPDIIKIDGEIIKNLAKSNDSKIILESIIYMSNLINSKTVAEFVEDKDIQDIVMKEGVDYSQGYYFSKPQPFCKLGID